MLSCSVAFPNLQVLLQEQVCVCIIKSVNTELGNWLSYKAALLVKNATLLASLEVAYAAKNTAYVILHHWHQVSYTPQELLYISVN